MASPFAVDNNNIVRHGVMTGSKFNIGGSSGPGGVMGKLKLH